MVSDVRGYDETADDLISKEELILLAHLRMSAFSMQSALEYMKRTDLTPATVNAFLIKKLKKTERLFEVFGPIVHERRKREQLPSVRPPKKPPPKNQPYDFRRR